MYASMSRRERLAQARGRVDALRKSRESIDEMLMKVAVQMANESLPYVMLLMFYLRIAAH